MNRHFTEGDTLRANKPMKRCSASLASRKTHTKTTKCHRKQKPVTTPQAEKLDHIYTGGGMENGTAIPGKQFNSFFKKTKHTTIYDSAITLLGIYPRRMKTYIHTNIRTRTVKAPLFPIDQSWKPPCSLSKGV